MTRTVIRIEELVNQHDDTQVLLRPEEPQDVKDYGSPRELDCRVHEAPFSDLAAVVPGHKDPLPAELVRKVGERLYKGLGVHGGVHEAIERATAKTKHGMVHPIYLASDAMDAEALPFEVLYHPSESFLGLDPRFPIARLVGQQTGTISRFVKLPIRLAAVLAAADRDAIPEWESLRAAIVSSKLPVDVTLFAARDDLAAHVTAQTDPWVTLERVPAGAEEMMEALTKLRPQFLHVFSHGSAQYQGYLEIATRNTVALGDPPFYLTAKELSRLRDLVWLITLNACEGAAPAADLHSVAYAVVNDGVPATIGMREVIDSADASCFCGAFYASALGWLAAELVPGARVKPDWGEAVRLARAALCARNPGPTPIVASARKPWTLPVLYRRIEDFVVQVAIPGLAIGDKQEQVFNEMEKLQQFKDGLPGDTPAAVVKMLENEIAQVRARLV
jgi:hypothetical protein